MADCLISGTLYKTVGASATEPRTSFTFYVGKGLLSGSQIAREKVAVTTDASDGTFSFAAQQGELINVSGDFVVGDYAFKDGLELFVPLSGTASFTSLKTPRDYVRALNSTVGNAPGDATFILQTADADLANAQALGALATGILKSTTSTGVLSIATAADLPLISTLTADATPDSAADYVLTYDASAGAHKKVLLSDLPGGGGGGGGTWGSITGTLSSQTDLQAALDLKAPLISPSFTTPTLGVASATSINKVALTAPATSATLTIADGKTFTASNTLTLTATDGSTLAIGTGGTLGSAAYTSASAYEVPLTFSTGLTRSVNTITVNTSQNIATLSNLTSDGLVTTSGGAGTLGVTVPGTGVLTALAVNVGSAGAFVVLNGAGGTPSSLTLTNATGLPISTGVSGLGTGVATFLATPSSANLAAAVTDETGSGALVFANSPTLVTPALGTPSSLTLTNATGLPPTTGISGWPANAAGVLTNNGSGTLSWGAAGGGITIGTTAIASGTATRLLYETAGNVVGEISGATSDGTTVTLTSPTINTGITLNAAPLTMSGNISSAAWTTNGIRIKGVAATLTDTTSSGTVAAAYTNNLGGNTIAASSSTTFTDYYTAFITQPTAGTNVTFTNRWALGLSGAGQVNQNSIGTTSTDGWVLQNSTAAAAGAQQYSPRIRLTGQGWKTNATAASQTVDWIFENQPVQGATAPTTRLSIKSQINAGGYSELGYFDSANGFILSNNVPLQVKKAGGTLVPAVKMETFDVLYFGTSSAQQTVFQGDPILFTLRNTNGGQIGLADVFNSRIAWALGSSNTVTTDTLNVSDRGTANNTTVVFRASPNQVSSSKIFRIMATDGTTEKYGVAADGYVITYNGAATAGIGTTPVYASVASTGQTASITTTNLQVGGAVAPSGLYKVTYYVVATTAGTSGTLDVTIAWNDGTAARSDANTSAITFGSTAYATKSVIIRADGTNNITYATTVNSPVGSPVYAIYLVLERLA